MATYVLAYKGGSMPDTEAEREAVMAAWGAFFQNLDGKVVDAGNPFGSAATIAPDGSIRDGAESGLSGYSIVSANDLGDATALAKACPLLAAGGTVEVHEVAPVM